MTITIDGNGTITGASTLATTVASPTLTTPNINSAQFATVTGTAPIYPCRAWVNFNGTGTVAIRASGNVSSITDVGVGQYTVNFTNAMPDANYAVSGICGFGGNGMILYRQTGAAMTTTSVFLTAVSTANAVTDQSEVLAAIFR